MGSFNIILIVLCVNCLHGYSYGQRERKFFRKDYQYIDNYKSFYKVSTVQQTWGEAKQFCELEGATLFYPRDKSEAASLMNYWADSHLINAIFIGASSSANGKYRTVDDTLLSNAYSNLDTSSAPGRRDCVVMRKNTSMFGDACGKRYPFVCKKSIDTLEWDNKCNLPYKGYVLNKELGKCYKFHLTPMDWSKAYAMCKAELSYLTVINSQAEADHLVRITAAAPKDNVQGNYLRGVIHAGFHNRYSEGWRTIHDVVLADSGFNGWATNEPNGGDGERCGSMYYTGQLNDIGCFHKCFFVCEHDVNNLSASIDERTPAQ